MYAPFPEEFNRKSISSIATFHFAPTKNNQIQLLKEGIPKKHIFVTGNTVIDSVKLMETDCKTKIPRSLVPVQLKDRHVILVTIHRRENYDLMHSYYGSIFSVPCPECLFIIPLHPNPRAKMAAQDVCRKDRKRFLCIAPLAYEELHWILSRSQFIVTDSGGLQEEATWYPVPSLVLRNSTERIEAVQSGNAILIGGNMTLLRHSIRTLSNTSSSLYKSMSKPHFPFGHGNASDQILNILLKHDSPTKTVVMDTKSINTSESHDIEPQPMNALLHQNEAENHRYKTTIGVVLQVYKRNSLQYQLDSIVSQTLVPSSVIIVQNGFHQDVSRIITAFRMRYVCHLI